MYARKEICSLTDSIPTQPSVYNISLYVSLLASHQIYSFFESILEALTSAMLFDLLSFPPLLFFVDSTKRF